jgi:hypothetical protein
LVGIGKPVRRAVFQRVETSPDAAAGACFAAESTATVFSVIFDRAAHALHRAILPAGARADHAYRKPAW